MHDTYDQSDSEKECPLSPTGRHVWKEAGVFTEYLIVRHHVMICEYCGKGRRSYGDLLSGRRSYHSGQQDQSSDEPDARLISGSGIRPPDQPESGPLSGFYSSVSKIQGSSSVPEPPVIVIFVRSSCTPGRMPFCTSPWPPQLICPFPPMIPVHLTFGRIFVVQ